MNKSPLNSGLAAGAAEADITPGMGIQLAGDIGRCRPVEEVRDPLFAKALVLEAGDRRVCLLMLDVLAISRKWCDEIRSQVAARFGFEPGAIQVGCTQNHAAPSLGHNFVWDTDESGVFPADLPWVLGGDERYNPVAVQGVLKAVEQALAALRPVSLSLGRAVDGRVAFNRRFIMRDGSGRTHPGACNPDVLYNEGPMDPEVGVAVLTAENGRAVAALLHHTCHPVHGYPQRWVSAGWPGAWCNGVRNLLGPACMPMVLNGCCGNIHHRNHLDPDYQDDHQVMGRKLTETVGRLLPNLKPAEAAPLDWRFRWLRIPMRTPPESDVAESQALLRDHPTPVWKDPERTAIEWNWIYAASRMDLLSHYRRDPFFEYPVQSFRLGGLGLLVLAGEPFVEEQLRVKLESPVPVTFVAHMSNTYVGYIPTGEALKHGGYETRWGNWSKLEPAALRTIGDAGLGQLRELFPGGRGAAEARP